MQELTDAQVNEALCLLLDYSPRLFDAVSDEHDMRLVRDEIAQRALEYSFIVRLKDKLGLHRSHDVEMYFDILQAPCGIQASTALETLQTIERLPDWKPDV